jgi:hypothetical protein
MLESADRTKVREELYGLRSQLMMFSMKLKKRRVVLKPALFTISWYPSSRSCVDPARRKIHPQQMPPLMVRKAEWRR